MRFYCWATTAALICCSSALTMADDVPMTAVQRGRDLFRRVWTEDEGMGPEHNAKSCVACHVQGGIGGAGDNEANVDVVSVLNSNTQSVWIDHGFAGKRSVVLHRSSTDRSYASRRFALLGIDLPRDAPCDELLAGSKALRKMIAAEQRLRQRGHSVSFRAAGATIELARRNTTPLFGLGEIDRISTREIQQAAAQSRNRFPQVAGRHRGKFGWRGQTKSLKQFVMDACENEIGLSREDAESKETVDALVKELAPRTTTADFRRKLDVGEDLTAFIAALPRPRQVLPKKQLNRVMVQHGAKLFETVGCAACHTPKVGPVDGLYSDLLVHDMGPALADNGADPARTPPGPSAVATGSSTTSQHLQPVPARARREWKTPALWGCAESAPYLHDGRAPTLHTAILLHGGEATGSVAFYRRLDTANRNRLLAFLNTLRGPATADLERVTGPTQAATMFFGHW